MIFISCYFDPVILMLGVLVCVCVCVCVCSLGFSGMELSIYCVFLGVVTVLVLEFSFYYPFRGWLYGSCDREILHVSEFLRVKLPLRP